ncbi:phage portal protein [Escherichia coli]|nr:phage portal protein [Escherichia coli]
MGIFSRLTAAIAPVTSLKRARARIQLDAIRAYEAAKPSRTRATKRETRSADNAVFAAGVSLREQARWLDENHDLAIGVLDKLEERIVGPHGIQIEPQPLTLTGDVHEDFAALLASRFAKWAENPDVTGMFTLAEAERILLRSALRDGEVFIQLLRGAVPDLKYDTPEKFALELLEADFVPMWPSGADGSNRIIQGITVNRWAVLWVTVFIKITLVQGSRQIRARSPQKICCTWLSVNACTRCAACRYFTASCRAWEI